LVVVRWRQPRIYSVDERAMELNSVSDSSVRGSLAGAVEIVGEDLVGNE
jgi:hypothetical protein